MPRTLHDLAEGRLMVYIMTRLFDFIHKISAEHVEQAVLRGLKRAFAAADLVPSAPVTFVPFRDTEQDKIEALDKTRIIYEEDLKRLDRLFALVGLLDGLAKDEGVCFEIGYAYGVNAPILLVLTDFLRREFKELPGSVHLADPVLLAMSSQIIYEYQIPDLADETFHEALLTGLQGVYDQIAEQMYQWSNNLPSTSRLDCGSEEPDLDIYLDFGGGHFEWERDWQDKLVKQLSGRGLSVLGSKRYRNPSKNVVKLGQQDIAAAKRARVVVTCGDGDEMSSGSAAIQGLSRALGKRVVLYDSRVTDLVGDGQHRMSRNLMIDYSANTVIRTFMALADAIENEVIASRAESSN